METPYIFQFCQTLVVEYSFQLWKTLLALHFRDCFPSVPILPSPLTPPPPLLSLGTPSGCVSLFQVNAKTSCFPDLPITHFQMQLASAELRWCLGTAGWGASLATHHVVVVLISTRDHWLDLYVPAQGYPKCGLVVPNPKCLLMYTAKFSDISPFG